MTTQEIAQRMAAFSASRETQVRQTAFRCALAEFWGVSEGDRVLEIGCGQGDTTAVLAARGASVMAVDPAPPTYGAPVTLGEATAHLATTDLGARIDFRLDFDPLSESFPEDAFDAVVLAHCSWYFASEETLRATLARVRFWAPRLLFSEWGLRPTTSASLGHLLAVTIQAQVEAFRPVSEANVRTPLTDDRLWELLGEAGWRVVREERIDSSELDDGRWEMDAALGVSLEGLPPRLRSAVETQREIVRSLRVGARSLDSYALIAERA